MDSRDVQLDLELAGIRAWLLAVVREAATDPVSRCVTGMAIEDLLLEADQVLYHGRRDHVDPAELSPARIVVTDRVRHTETVHDVATWPAAAAGMLSDLLGAWTRGGGVLRLSGGRAAGRATVVGPDGEMVRATAWYGEE
ncbi:hypothetical protein [Tsukamurella soli]